MMYIEVEQLAKTIWGKKWSAIGNIEIIMGTSWELDGNRMGIKK